MLKFFINMNLKTIFKRLILLDLSILILLIISVFYESEIVVALGVDGGPTHQCSNPGDDSAGSKCSVSDDGDDSWTISEYITISEGAEDVCSASCEIELKILKIEDGDTYVLHNEYVYLS